MSLHCERGAFGLVSTSLFVVLVHVMLALPPHKVASERKQDRIDGTPSDQDAKVEADARVKVKKDLAAAFDHVMQRPRVAPVVKAGFCARLESVLT